MQHQSRRALPDLVIGGNRAVGTSAIGHGYRRRPGACGALPTNWNGLSAVRLTRQVGRSTSRVNMQDRPEPQRAHRWGSLLVGPGSAGGNRRKKIGREPTRLHAAWLTGGGAILDVQQMIAVTVCRPRRNRSANFGQELHAHHIALLPYLPAMSARRWRTNGEH